MIEPYIDSKNIGDFTLFIKNPSPGYLYGIRYVDISIDEYICDVKDTISSHINVYKVTLTRRCIL